MPGSKSDLLHYLEKFNKEAATDNDYELHYTGWSSNRRHDQTDWCDNLPGIRNSKFHIMHQKQLQRSERVDIVWDVYVENSLKPSARHKRGNNIN